MSSNRWAQNRQTAIVLVFLGFLGAVVFGVYALFFHKTPTCFDGILNGSEDGIDCGGTCTLVCPFNTAEPNILWSRSFEISDGVYNLTGVIENPNFDVKVETQYKFEAYNAQNALVEEVFGGVTIYPTQKKPIFEPTIRTGFQDIARVFLRIVGEPIWTKSDQLEQTVFVTSRNLEDQDTAPKLEVSLVNRGIVPERNMSITAVLYNTDGNVVQSSQTFLDYIDRDDQASVFFTWPEAFTEEVTSIEVFINEISLL